MKKKGNERGDKLEEGGYMRVRSSLPVWGALTAILLVAGCQTAPKMVDVYLRSDVDTTKSRIIVFPMLLAQGNSLSPANAEYSNPLADALLGKQWGNALGGGGTVTVPKIVLDKIPGAPEAITAIVKALDKTSAVEQTTRLTSFLGTISEKFGDGALAFCLVFENKNAYKSSKTVHLNMGLFDTKKLTWKWITKHSYQGGMVPVPYEKVTQDLVRESFKALIAKNDGSVK